MKKKKDILKEIKAIQKQFALDMQRFRESQIETERVIKESQLETDRQFKETDKKFQETDKFIKETEIMVKETTRQIREHGLQIGGIQKSFGKFTEELFFSSLQSIMLEKFKLQFFDTNVTRSSKDDNFEADAIAFSNGESNSLYIVEIKSHFSKTAFKQLTKKLSDINKFCPEHISKKKYGVMAAPHLKPSQLQEILKAGFYPATLKGDLLVIENPDNFKPKEF